LIWFAFSGNEHGRAFRDYQLEEEIHKLTQNLGIGAQFGGKYFCHDVRVIRLPRHGASCPVGIGVSCSADRQVSLIFVTNRSTCFNASTHTVTQTKKRYVN
jgi:tartrate dehydratase alpha subunit/fumarate hydratase class I-like protein